jgi:hypothetical protein
MELQTVAVGLADLMRAGQFGEAIEQYYAADVVSVEAAGESREVRGLEAVRAKAAWWNEAFETHAVILQGPFYHGDDQFAVVLSMEVTNRKTADRITMDEIGVYTIADGKVVHEHFFG